MRVHEIAKKLGMESRLVIPELVRLGIQVTSHSNAVEDDAARWAMDVLQGKVDAPKGASPPEGVARNLELKKTGGRLLKKDASASGKAGADATAPEPKKPEKKHILIKKKKTEEELAAEAQEFPSVKEASGEDSVCLLKMQVFPPWRLQRSQYHRWRPLSKPRPLLLLNL